MKLPKKISRRELKETYGELQGKYENWKEDPKAQRKFRKFKKIAGTVLAILFMTCVIFACIFKSYVDTKLAPILDIDASAYTLKLSSVVYYQNDQGDWVELQKLHGTENRSLVEFEDVPEHVWQALVAVEDERFFKHHGVDWKSTTAAIVNHLLGGETTRGGSTITQQVVKNLTGENQTTVKRKVTEIFRALRFAKNYSREEILEMYLNLVYFGDGAYGISAAAETYFGKDVSELTVAEAASIIGITQYPYQYDPSRGDWYREQNKVRQETVLKKMWKQGYITRAEYEDAVEQELVFCWDDNYVEHGSKTEDTAAEVSNDYNSYFIEQMFNDVVADLVREKGYSTNLARDLLYTGGYKIYCTVDPEIQDQVELVYGNRENLPYKSYNGDPLQSGMTVIDNRTGDVVAIAGRVGERTGAFQWSYAANVRSCGSAIKPISTYAPALDLGIITPATVLDDYPVHTLNGKAWPKNAYAGYHGLSTMSYVLSNSSNTTAVRVSDMLTAPVSYEYLSEKFGITTLSPSSDLNSAALALGGLTHGVTTIEMAAAYSAFTNNGVYTKPRTYVEVRDNIGNIVLENKQESWVAVKESTVYQINTLLRGVVTGGTGTEAAFSGMTMAGKTGTTSDSKDRYFVGYTPYYTAAVWVGYDRPTAIRAAGNPAAALWRKVMQPVHANLPDKAFPSNTAGMTSVTTCTKTGLLAGSDCTETQTVLVTEGTAPTLVCDGHTTVTICNAEGKQAGAGCPAEETTVVGAINLTAPNLSAAPQFGYVRELIGDDDGGYVSASDSNAVLQDLLTRGVCTVHSHTESVEDLPGIGDEPEETDAPEQEPSGGHGFLGNLFGGNN